jgi:hypothetical protein
MNTAQKIILIGIAAAVFCVLATITYNVYDTNRKQENYKQCLETNERLMREAIANGRNPQTLFCYGR